MTTLDDVLDAHRRDLRAVREDLLEAQEKAAQQTLAAHMRALKLREEDAARAEDFRVETRARLERIEADQRRALTLLERAVEIPASPGPVGRLVERVGAWLGMRPAAARQVVLIALLTTLAAGLGALLSACTVAGALHTRAPAALDPTPLGGLYP